MVQNDALVAGDVTLFKELNSSRLTFITIHSTTEDDDNILLTKACDWLKTKMYIKTDKFLSYNNIRIDFPHKDWN